MRDPGSSKVGYYHAKAQEYELASTLCESAELRDAFRQVAESYRALADKEEWLDALITPAAPPAAGPAAA
jgi:hypothetical protein